MPGLELGSRALFPDLQPEIYLNHSAISPASTLARDAVNEVLADYAAHGMGAVMRWIEQRNGLRADLARLLNAPSTEDVALVPNTTLGVNDVALCFPWKPGDRVLLFEGEFPANTTPWQQAARLFDVEVVWVPAAAAVDGDALEAVERELARGVRLVAVSAVQFQTGWRMPVEALGALCRAHGAQLFVDGVQACGVVPIDVQAMGIDYLSCGGHKWMMGFEGAGFLYVSPERVADLEPRVAGWLSHEEPLTFLFAGAGHLRYDRAVRKRADFVEGGSQNLLGYAALGASTKALLELGVEAIFDHVTAYLDDLEPRLTALGLKSVRRRGAGASGIFSTLLPEGVDLSAMKDALGARGVSCSTPDGHLRFAPHWSNNLDEVPRVAASVEAALAELRG